MGVCKRHTRRGRSSNPNIQTLVGEVFGRLTVLKDDGSRSSSGAVSWLCRCSCGSLTHRVGSILKRTPNSSCGCYTIDRMKASKFAKTHGMSATKVYKNWFSMKRRCTDPKHKNYKEYGARGIKVCESWLSFEIFYKDMGGPPKGMTLDRKDNNKGYYKDNCRWASHTVQMNNTRKNTYLILNGITKTMAEWARDPVIIALGLDYYTIRGRRTVCKWSDSKILTTPHKNKE